MNFNLSGESEQGVTTINVSLEQNQIVFLIVHENTVINEFVVHQDPAWDFAMDLIRSVVKIEVKQEKQ